MIKIPKIIKIIIKIIIIIIKITILMNSLDGISCLILTFKSNKMMNFKASLWYDLIDTYLFINIL